MEKEIITRSHRMSKELRDKILVESNKTGDSENSTINQLIADGLRFRSASIVIHVQE